MSHSQNHSQRHKKNRVGFTLVEVLVVMAILALLAGLVLPRVLGSKKSADIDAAKAQIGILQGALEHYALHMNDFPTTEQGLKALIESPETSRGRDGESTDNWDGPYLNKTNIPLDPWGNEFRYEYPPTHGKGKDPEIWSHGPDGADDTDDDITSWDRDSSKGQSGAPSRRR